MQVSTGDSLRNNGLTIAQLAISGLGMVFALVAAAILAVIGLSGVLSGTAASQDALSLLSLAWVCLLAALLAMPSAVYATMALLGRPFRLPSISGFRLANFAILLWPLVLALGHFLSGTSLAWLFLPPLQLLAFGLPIWWLVEVARHGIHISKPQRDWGLLTVSLFVTTPTVIVVELVIMIVLFVGLVLLILSQPGLAFQMEDLAAQILNSGGDEQAVLEAVRPFLQNPWVVYSLLFLLGGLMPAVEELFKPLAMWSLFRRRLTPAEGFVAGAICGAAFALLESLINLAGPAGESWAALVVGRAGTGLLHIVTTALVGWAIASAWRGEGIGRSLLAYILAVAMHGLWNALTVLTGLTLIFEDPPDSLRLIEQLSWGAPVAIILLAGMLFVLLWASNRRLRQDTRVYSTAAAPDLP